MENKKIKILAIDDNRDNLISLKAIISEVIPQSVVYMELSGQDGIGTAKKIEPDVILLDIVMPGMDGYEVCKTLKTEEHLSETPIIFLTALKGDKQSRILALEAGGEAFIAKPIDATELKAQILAMLKIKEAAKYKRDQRLQLEEQVQKRTEDLKNANIAALNLLEDLNNEIEIRKQSEVALRESEERFRVAQEFSPDGFSIFHPVRNEKNEIIDFTWVYENQTIARINGTDPKEVIGKRLLALFPTHKKTSVFEAYINVANSKKPLILEEVYVGEILSTPTWLRLVVVPMSTDIAILAQNITDRKRAEEKVVSINKMLGLVMNSIPQFIFWKDRNSIYLGCNENFAKVAGVNSPEDIIGKTDFDLAWKKEEAIYFRECDERVLKSGLGEYHIIEPQLQADGRQAWLNTNKLPLFDEVGKVIGLLGTYEDITERKQTEEKLKLLNRAVEASSVTVVITDAEGHINYVNPYFTELTGYSYEEVLGNNPRILKSGNQPKTFYEELWNTILLGREWTGEFQNRKKNGALYWENAIISPILNSKGVITNFVAIKDDITERKEMLEELIAAKEKAEESDKLKTAFINNISHEIRTPLNSILGFGQIMAESELSAVERSEFFDHVQKSSNRLMNTVTDYMDMAMLVSNTMKAYKKEFVLEPILLKISEKAKQLCLAKNLKFDVIIPIESKGLTVNSDPEFLQKILEKLIDNAIKFTNEGIITCGYQIKKEHIEFFVKDTGNGLDDDKLDLIFEGFRQADTSMTRGYEGSGLGLTIAKGLGALIGGEITVASEKGKGSVFTFNIPLNNPGKSISHDTIDVTKPKSTKKPLILIAEDDDLNYLYMATILESFGYNIIHAENGKEAVDFCRHNAGISIVFMDIKMPEMNGDEATKQIRLFRPELPIIATTAYAQTGDENSFLEAGCTDYISKPIKKEKLLAFITKYVG